MTQWFDIGASVSTVRLYMSQGDLCCAHGAVKNANGQAGDTCWGEQLGCWTKSFCLLHGAQGVCCAHLSIHIWSLCAQWVFVTARRVKDARRAVDSTYFSS